ncbi:MAG TPA: AraC family transcriptional regulator [Synergistaceae bacterium]|nr:AraC family transcriptional regulator [Synergistaceae bacterium]
MCGERESFARSEKALQEYRRRICQAMDFIEGHLEENPSLEEIARAASFSKYHFHRLFKSLVGESVGEFTRRLRVEKAACFLRFSHRVSVTEVAHRWGFSSSQNFARAFRKHFGCSPSEFRKRFRKIGTAASKEGDDFGKEERYAGWHHISIPERSNIMAMHVEVMEMPSYFVAYVRNVGPYGPEGCGGAFQKLMEWAEPRGFSGKGAVFFGICLDDPDITPPEKCRYDACVAVPEGRSVEGEVGVQTLPGGLYGVYRKSVRSGEYTQAWEELLGSWFPRSGYEPDSRPFYERYVIEEDFRSYDVMSVEFCAALMPLQ